MNLPARYLKFSSDLPVREVSFGCGGIRLFSDKELKAEQTGYSVSPEGRSLCGDAAGDWRSSWIVIGCDTGVGDPIFMDTSDPQLGVFTAIHGEGSWEPLPIANSIEAFAGILDEFARIAKGRSNPVEQENNPLDDADREAYLSCVDKLNNGQVEGDFWEEMLEY
jgi:hypothetical protein